MRALQVLAWMGKQAEKDFTRMSSPQIKPGMGYSPPWPGGGSIGEINSQKTGPRLGGLQIQGNQFLNNPDAVSFSDPVEDKDDFAGVGSNADRINHRMYFRRTEKARPIDAFAKPIPAAPAAPAAPLANKAFEFLPGHPKHPYTRAVNALQRGLNAAYHSARRQYTHPGMNFVNGDYDLSRIKKPFHGDPRWEEDYNTAKTYAFDPDPIRRENAAYKMKMDTIFGKHTPKPDYAHMSEGSISLTDRIKAQERLYNDYWNMARKSRDQDMLYATVDAANKVTAPGMQSVWNLHPKANQKPANPWDQESGLPRPLHPSKMFNDIVHMANETRRAEEKNKQLFPNNNKQTTSSWADNHMNWDANNWVTNHDRVIKGPPYPPYYPENSANHYILKNIINSPHRLKLNP